MNTDTDHEDHYSVAEFEQMREVVLTHEDRRHGRRLTEFVIVGSARRDHGMVFVYCVVADTRQDRRFTRLTILLRGTTDFYATIRIGAPHFPALIRAVEDAEGRFERAIRDDDAA